VLGGFIMAATEYERMNDTDTSIHPVKVQDDTDQSLHSLTGSQLRQPPLHGIYIKGGKKIGVSNSSINN
jgi:hypothetical protein